MRLTFVLSTWRNGKCSNRSWNVKMESSFFNNSPRWGPTPFRYSMGLDNIEDTDEIQIFSGKNSRKAIPGYRLLIASCRLDVVDYCFLSDFETLY